MIKLLKKLESVPDILIPKTKSFMVDANHGILLCVISLSIEICKANLNYVQEYKSVIIILIFR